jgi:hypothetical protein
MLGLVVQAYCTIFLVLSSMMKKIYQVFIPKIAEAKKSQANKEFQWEVINFFHERLGFNSPVFLKCCNTLLMVS